MTRLPPNLLTGLSLLTCVAVAALWVRSYYAFDAVNMDAPNGSLALAAPAGRVWLVYDTQAPRYRIQRDSKPVLAIDSAAAGWTGARQAFGFTWILTPNLTALLVPFWSLALATLVLPAFRLSRAWRRARARRARPLCRFCGYDLTGNVSGVCPECGRNRE